jgi:hypothetical protein
MPVDEDINLNKPLTDAQLRKLERDAERMEIAARKAEENARKISEEASKAADVLLNAEKFMGRSPLAGMGGDIDVPDNTTNILGIGATGQSVLPTKGRRSGQTVGRSPVSGISVDVVNEQLIAEQEALKEEQRQAKIERERIMTEQKAQAQRIKEIQMRENQIRESFQRPMSGIRQGYNFTRNPTGFALGKLKGLIVGGGFYGAIALMVMEFGEEIYNMVINEIKGLYEPGGIFDKRKEMLNDMKQVANLEHMVDIHQGRVFFTSDTGEFLRQGIPQNYNTRKMVNGYKQYIQEFDS